MDNQKALYVFDSDVSYFNCAYMSPLLKSVQDAGMRGMQRKARPWAVPRSDFFEDAEVLRILFGRLINGDPEGVALIPSASYGLAIAANNVKSIRGQNIVVLSEQFPSNVYCWMNLASRKGLELRQVPRPSDGNWTPGILERIDSQTAVVAVPHCHWTDGTPVDLLAVRQACDRTGSSLVLDLSQSLGVLEFDAQKIRPDFLVCVGYKWLQGPYSIAFLYADKSMRHGEPLEHNWINRVGSEHFAKLIEYQPRLRPGARRYDVGEHSNFILLPMAIAALDQVLAWGPSSIACTLKPLTNQIRRGALELGLSVAEHGSPHFLGVRFPWGVGVDLSEHLWKDGISLGVRGDSIRIAPYLYNDERDVLRLLKSLAEYTKSKGL